MGLTEHCTPRSRGGGGGLSPKFKNPLNTIDFTDPGGLISAWFKNCVDF